MISMVPPPEEQLGSIQNPYSSSIWGAISPIPGVRETHYVPAFRPNCHGLMRFDNLGAWPNGNCTCEDQTQVLKRGGRTNAGRVSSRFDVLNIHSLPDTHKASPCIYQKLHGPLSWLDGDYRRAGLNFLGSLCKREEDSIVNLELSLRTRSPLMITHAWIKNDYATVLPG
ncbi:hypothetical protein VNO77_34478 [Canavalia gladiata]|uniref:Uncharacterized protein n=1 Tax=Canavalia gladiata TaxID=3824 RepID=A0AAN9KG84_CANGL